MHNVPYVFWIRLAAPCLRLRLYLLSAVKFLEIRHFFAATSVHPLRGICRMHEVNIHRLLDRSLLVVELVRRSVSLAV